MAIDAPCMEPIFDFFAQTVGWLKDEIVYDKNGSPVAMIKDEAVFAASSHRYLGQCYNGVFHDHLGCVVAFTRGNRWFTVLKTPPVDPEPPMVRSCLVFDRADLPAPPRPLVKPLLDQSNLDWAHFLRNDKAQPPWKTRC